MKSLLPGWIRDGFVRILRPIPRALIARDVHPNTITTVGFLITCTAGLVYFMGHVRIGGALVILGGILDILDGQVARGSGKNSVFGSFYDSTLDRISEVIVFLGILSLYGGEVPEFEGARQQFTQEWMAYVVALAMAGSLMVSYTRARAEALGLDCKVGMMQRAERVVLIGLSSWWFGGAFGGFVLTGVLILMAVLTNITAFQRIVWVYRHTRPDPSVEIRAVQQPPAVRAPYKRRMNS